MTFIKSWSVILIDSFVSESTFRRWMRAAGVPSCWSFYVDPFGQIMNQWTSYGTFPFPAASNSISIFKGSATTSNVLGICLPDQRKCCIGVWDGDTDIDIGARIWHEFMHAQGIDVDAMKTTYKEEFHDYLISINSPYADFYYNVDKYDQLDTHGHSEILCAFYTFLTEEYFGCECFNWGCDAGDPPVTPPVYPPVVPPVDPPITTNPYIKWINENPAMAGIIGVIGFIGVVVLIKR